MVLPPLERPTATVGALAGSNRPVLLTTADVREVGREAGWWGDVWWGDAWASASDRSFRQVTALQHSPRLLTSVVAVDALHREAPVGRLGGRCQEALLVSPRLHRRWEVSNPPSGGRGGREQVEAV